MAFTRIIADMNNHQRLSDEPNIDNGLTAEELKKLYDKAANDLKDGTNKLMDELEDIREGYEAARTITAAKMYDTDDSDRNIQAKLVKLKQIMDETAQGAVPDGSIGREKLNFADTIPTNDQMGILYLASKYTKPVNVGESAQTYITPSLTSDNRQGYTVNIISSGSVINSVADPYTFVGGNGDGYLEGEETDVLPLSAVIVEFPGYIKLDYVTFSTDIDKSGYGHLTISVSNDGIEYEQLTNYTIPGYYSKNFNTVTLNENRFWKYIKFELYTTYNGSSECGLYNNIKFFGETVSELSKPNQLEITTEGNAKLTTYEIGQIVKILTPDTYVSGINILPTLNINSLGAKALPNDLQPSTRYSLVYNGTAFEKEV